MNLHLMVVDNNDQVLGLIKKNLEENFGAKVDVFLTSRDAIQFLTNGNKVNLIIA